MCCSQHTRTHAKRTQNTRDLYVYFQKKKRNTIKECWVCDGHADANTTQLTKSLLHTYSIRCWQRRLKDHVMKRRKFFFWWMSFPSFFTSSSSLGPLLLFSLLLLLLSLMPVELMVFHSIHIRTHTNIDCNNTHTFIKYAASGIYTTHTAHTRLQAFSFSFSLIFDQKYHRPDTLVVVDSMKQSSWSRMKIIPTIKILATMKRMLLLIAYKQWSWTHCRILLSVKWHVLGSTYRFTIHPLTYWYPNRYHIQRTVYFF